MSRPDAAQFVPVSRLYGSVARLLRAASLVLALLFLLRVLLSLGALSGGPLALALRFCDALVGQAPVAVMAVCLLGLSLLIDEQSASSRRLARSLRTAALPVAIGYLLLIPVYGSAQWWRSRLESTSLRQGMQSSLEQLRSARQEVLGAGSSRDLERIWQALPAGSPPLARFGADLPQRRRTLIDFLDQVQRILTLRLQGIEQRLLLRVARDTALFSLACLGLAALFYRSSQLDLPYRRRRLAAGVPGCRPRSGRRGALDLELEQLFHESGAAEELTTGSGPDAAGEPPGRAEGEPGI